MAVRVGVGEGPVVVRVGVGEGAATVPVGVGVGVRGGVAVGALGVLVAGTGVRVGAGAVPPPLAKSQVQYVP